MLWAYCKEFERDGGKGTPSTAGDVTQESLGFSAAELVFSQTVRGEGGEGWLTSLHPQIC